MAGERPSIYTESLRKGREAVAPSEPGSPSRGRDNVYQMMNRYIPPGKIRRPGTILSVGCAYGIESVPLSVLYADRSVGFDVPTYTGVDIDPMYIRIGQGMIDDFDGKALDTFFTRNEINAEPNLNFDNLAQAIRARTSLTVGNYLDFNPGASFDMALMKMAQVTTMRHPNPEWRLMIEKALDQINAGGTFVCTVYYEYDANVVNEWLDEYFKSKAQPTMRISAALDPALEDYPLVMEQYIIALKKPS